ncbi:MAG: hypothetical protein PHC28_08225 [Flavobacterium sp.]|uniref:hypothetical protein n=1 Tax=Flavobacterium sp. TaxID=239 RepID=UPI002610B61B|nr:hypothetical protein [Flavobacterium sp.]MDD5150457.1 hypothetical protein [Flavobacterium sp.]
MEFSKIVLEKLGLIFKEYSLNIIERRSDYLKLNSKYLRIIISHNRFENSNTIWLGRNDEKSAKVEIDDEILKQFFNSKLKLSQVSTETFINNLVLFFENEALPLFTNNKNKISELEKFNLDRSQKYTQELLVNQNLFAANKEWEFGNYKEFIKLIDKIDKVELPTSYQLKYNIAKHKVEK